MIEDNTQREPVCLVAGDLSTAQSVITMSTSISAKSYRWLPAEDITAYELALCMPVFAMATHAYTGADFVGALPESARRHFEEIHP